MPPEQEEGRYEVGGSGHSAGKEDSDSGVPGAGQELLLPRLSNIVLLVSPIVSSVRGWFETGVWNKEI